MLSSGDESGGASHSKKEPERADETDDAVQSGTGKLTSGISVWLRMSFVIMLVQLCCAIIACKSDDSINFPTVWVAHLMCHCTITLGQVSHQKGRPR